MSLEIPEKIEIPEKCKDCIHRLRDYCRANKVKIAVIAVSRCTRKKTTKSRKLRRKKK